MVDRKARDKLAELLRHLVAGQITNDEFEYRIPISSEDLAIFEIYLIIAAWPLYDDFYEHTLTGKHRVPDEYRREIAKCVLFLKTDQEYQWPYQTDLKKALMFLLWLVSLGRAGYRFKKVFESAGEIEVWPFIRQKDLETARKRPPYLAGRRSFEYKFQDYEIFARVKAFVAKQVCVSAEKLNPDTLLADDLGIAGDDGYELLEAFCEEFEIQNMSEIDHTEYFGTEGCDLLIIPYYLVLDLYYLVFDREKLREELGHSGMPLTLRDLVKSAEAKRWIPPGTPSTLE